ncbi:MAG: 23S rRNA (pseudouridine(1915)-N(3))-methyltransferase RlmH [candidate division Zixibacteria bacterium]|nr:23S rRNA (pseudouridine(1915)-N(3))-methyltransferase RlmH [candidate division Zixibacteria bacterium]MCK4605690.1 23S rRNA (pseudouridine(1915)-N(3))-methyltransferase RlmH [candidate division Zixibacteria bacterium]
MLKIRIIAVSKDKDRWVTDGCAHYEKLLLRYASVQWVIIPATRATASLTPDRIREQEAERLLKVCGKGFCIALTDKGTLMDSPTLARQLEKWQTRSRGILSFVIGGAHGLDQAVLERSQFTLSLSPLTFSHQVVRAVLLEQLFRAFSILGGSNYHK